jgi:D-galacturonate reductase
MKIDVLVIGGGMIVHDQLLPALYHLQRADIVGGIKIAAASSVRLRELVSERFLTAFPGQSFTALPALDAPPEQREPDLWRTALADLPACQLVIVATPDQTHDEMVRAALEHNQHVLCVKPLVHRADQAEAIGRLAAERGLLVAVEYHKRFDRRALEARRLYREGRFGEFACGQARMIEPYYYRHSNFQNWFTCDQTDPFVYVGCHYLDLVCFITGLRPIEVSCRGVERTFPNGSTGFMWAHGRVAFENGAVLGVSAGLGYPDRGAGPNDQGLVMYCEGRDCGAIIEHHDQSRGVGHGYVDDRQGAHYRLVNPDYFRLVPWNGPGLKPVGYGYDSVAAALEAAAAVNAAGLGNDARNARQAIVRAIDDSGLLATPSNSLWNELVIEAARASILSGGKPVPIPSR